MDALKEILDPYFVAAIVALTELLKTFLVKVNHRILTVVATLLVCAGAYLGFGFDAAETLINGISGLLSGAGIYSLGIKPFKK